jgi:hypothetical protein
MVFLAIPTATEKKALIDGFNADMESYTVVDERTGAAAMEIGGVTTNSEFHYMQKKNHATIADIDAHKDTRLNIIDEISFAGYKHVLEKTSHFLQNATECREFLYGSAAIVFLGDFCQLETIDKDVIYKNGNGLIQSYASPPDAT